MKIKSEVNSPFAEGSSYPTDDPNWNSVVNWLHRPGVWIIVHLRLLCSITRQNLRPNERKGQLIAKQKKLSDQNRSVDFFFGGNKIFFFLCNSLRFKLQKERDRDRYFHLRAKKCAQVRNRQFRIFQKAAPHKTSQS